MGEGHSSDESDQVQEAFQESVFVTKAIAMTDKVWESRAQAMKAAQELKARYSKDGERWVDQAGVIDLEDHPDHGLSGFIVWGHYPGMTFVLTPDGEELPASLVS